MKDKLLITSDLGLFKAVRVEFPHVGSPRFHTVEEILLVDGTRRISERVSDSAGQKSAPTQKTWGAPITDSNNIALETRRRLLKQVAERTGVLMKSHDVEECWLAAPKEICNALMDEMAADIRPRITKVVPNNLVKLHPKDLFEHFESNGSRGESGLNRG